MYAIVEWNRHGASIPEGSAQLSIRENSDAICNALDSHATDPRGTVIIVEDRNGHEFSVEFI